MSPLKPRQQPPKTSGPQQRLYGARSRERQEAAYQSEFEDAVRMRGNAHVRFGGRAEESDEPQGPHRASVRPDHTHAPWLIAAGEHPKAIQTRLGHSSIQLTIDRYGHLMTGSTIGPQLDSTRSPGPRGNQT